MDFARQLTHELGLTETFSESFTIVYGFRSDRVLREFVKALRSHNYETSLVGEIDCEGKLDGVGNLVIYRKWGENPKVSVLNFDSDSRLTVSSDHHADINVDLKGPHRLIIKQVLV